jgi:hypothetical protein
MKRRSFLAGLLGSTVIAPAAIAARPPEPITLRPGEKIIVTGPTLPTDATRAYRDEIIAAFNLRQAELAQAIAALDAAEVPTASRFVFDGQNWMHDARKAR